MIKPDQSSRADVDSSRLRAVMGRFCTGVAVITGANAAEPAGMLVQSLASVSLDPPLLLFCPQKGSRSWSRIAATGKFGVNILSEHQRDLCTAFSRSGADKFRDVAWHFSRSGLPVLAGHLAYVDCEVDTVHEAGDHDIVLGRITDLRESDHETPLLFYRGRFGRWAA